MKPFKTNLGTITLFLALLLFASCSKNIDQPALKESNDISALAAVPTEACAPFIGLQLRNNAGGSYFFINTRTALANQQPFDGTSFPLPWLMSVTAGDGETVKEDNVSESIGITSAFDKAPVDAHAINPGETLIMKLGSALSGRFHMRGVELQFLGVAGTTGSVTFYRDGVEITDDFIYTSTNKNFGYAKFFDEPYENNIDLNQYFDEIRLTCYTGRYELRGRTNAAGSGLLPATRFYIYDPANQVVLTGGPTPNLNFVYRIVNGAFDLDNRQTFTGTSEAAGWLLGGSPNRWLKFAASSDEGPASLSYSFLTSRWGIFRDGLLDEQRVINGTEKVTITKGEDLSGFNKFAGMEIRTVYFPRATRNPLSVALYNGPTLVGTFLTNVPIGIPLNIKTVYFPPEGMVFDKVVITGTGSNASIGGGIAGASLRFYPGCN